MLVVIAAALAWCAACLLVEHRLARWLARQCGGDAITGAIKLVAALYCRVVHRLEVRGFAGFEALAANSHPGPLVVVANHTAGIDPLLIQSALRARVRWMMDQRMMVGALEWLWRRERIIPVDVEGGDTAAARAAIQHLREGGVVGIFPEGGLARPPEHVLPFLAGVGLVVARTGAPVLLCWITGTPRRDRAFDSFLARSRSRVTFLELVHYPPRTKPAAIADDLRRRLVAASGWPTAEAKQGSR